METNSKLKTKLVINIDKGIIGGLLFLLTLKLSFSYLNVELDWWQRHLTPNFDKFNFLNLSQNSTKNIEYLIIPLSIIFIFRNRKYLKGQNYAKNFNITLMCIVCMFLLNSITSFTNEVSLLSSFEYTIKLSSPILFFLVLILYSRRYRSNLQKEVFFILKLCVLLTFIGLIFFDPSYNHWQNWLPVFFASLHTHNYLMIAIGIGFSYHIYRKGHYLTLIIFLLSFLAFLYFGYRIRSAIAFYLVYLISVTFVINSFFKIFWIKMLIILSVCVLGYMSFSQSFDLNEYSSGRVTMYEAKWEMLKNYSITDYMFGEGRGADFIRTDDWWYEKKNSHNDFLTFLIENGVPYVLFFILLLCSLVPTKKKLNIIFASILSGYMISSLLSNGVALRPIAGYVLFMVTAYIYVDIYEHKNHSIISS